MSAQLLDSLKKKPKPKEFASIGIKVPLAKTDVVINTKITNKTSSKLVDRKEILQNLKKRTIEDLEATKVSLPKSSKKKLRLKIKGDTDEDALILDAVKAVPVKAVPVKAVPVKAEPVDAEPVDAEPDKAEPDEAEPDKAEPDEAEPDEAEPDKAEPDKAEPDKAEPKKLKIRKKTKRATISSETVDVAKDEDVLEELPTSLIVIDDIPIAERMAKPEPNIILQSSQYYMNNRENFINFVNGLFDSYKEELGANDDSVSCDSIYGSDDFSLLTHQKIVRDYMNVYTPYRGLLLYHGLGSGKTCSSIAIAEGFKTKNQIMVMTPASLRVNYLEELKKCGDLLYKKNQYWEFISTKEKPKYLDTLSEILSLDKNFIQRNNGAWLVNVKRESNFDSLSNEDKNSLNLQIDEMIKQKYQFISYNGLRRSHLSGFTKDFTINPFDNKVIIIDEVHNFVSRIVNKINSNESLSVILYQYLMSAENCRIIALSGTPIINYPNEIAILFNILRGYIKTWNIPLDIKTKQKVNEAEIKKLFASNIKLNNIIDFVEYKPSSKTLVLTKNPFGFINQYKNNVYKGIKVDEHGQIDDENFLNMVIQILSLNQIYVNKSNVEIINNTSLPDKVDPFNAYFINKNNNSLMNVNLFKRRILGLTSYYRSAQEKLMPRYSKEKNFTVVKVPMSDYQFGVYETARVEERKLEKKNKKKGKADASMSKEDSTSTYRIFSRAFCNFVFPKEIKRPIPKDEKEDLQEGIKVALSKGADEDIIDAVSAEERIKNIDGKYESDDIDELKADIAKNTDANYSEKIVQALKLLEANSSTYLNEEALAIYSPKFLKILQNLTDQSNMGSHLFYSQFRTIEGVGVFKLVLKHNGFAEFKIKKNTDDQWVVDIAEEDLAKPKFVLYTGTETAEEKEIIRKVYNDQWDDIPIKIKEVVSTLGANNQMGEIIKLFMITASGAEGISLKNTRFVHICEPYWHPVRIEQVIGRAKRICSHDKLPKELQTVDVFLYLMTFSKSQLDSDLSIELRINDTSKLDDKVPLTTDESLFEISNIKEDITKQLLIAVKETSMDCALHYKPGSTEPLACYSFGNSIPEKFSYVPSIKDEEDDKVSKINVKTKTFKAHAANINGTKYAVNKQTNEIYDYESYINSVKDSNINPRKLGNIVMKNGKAKVEWI